MQLELFDAPIDIGDIFGAYYFRRKNKRKTKNALIFEIDYEKNLYEFWEDINTGKYEVGRSIAFITNKPVKCEIFAADSRDRVVYHLIINKLNPLFKKTLSFFGKIMFF